MILNHSSKMFRVFVFISWSKFSIEIYLTSATSSKFSLKISLHNFLQKHGLIRVPKVSTHICFINKIIFLKFRYLFPILLLIFFWLLLHRFHSLWDGSNKHSSIDWENGIFFSSSFLEKHFAFLIK